MRRLILATLALLWAVSAANAQLPLTGAGKGVPGGAAYVGPGDIQSFTFWCGFRAYSAATAGTKAIRVIRASDSTQTDINTLANGSLDLSALTTFLNATTGKLVTCYDKVGTNDLTQATDANRPAITFNALNSSAGATFSSAAGTFLQCGTNITVNQPVSFATVIKQPVAANEEMMALDGGSFTGITVEFRTTSSGITVFAGSSFAASLSTAFHALQIVVNNASSVVARDGSEVTGTTGAQNVSNLPFTFGTVPSNTPTMNAVAMEVGWITGATSSGNRTSLNSNMHAAYGSW